MAAIQRGLFRRLGRRRNRREYLLPDSPLAPAGKAIVDGLARAVRLRAVPPAAAGLARQLRFLIFPSGGNETGSLRSPSAHALSCSKSADGLCVQALAGLPANAARHSAIARR